MEAYTLCTIHVGYGVEFGLNGMFVEGLALAAVEQGYVDGAFPHSAFTPTSTTIVGHIVNRPSSLQSGIPIPSDSSVVPKKGGVHAFDIVARILKDPRLRLRALADFLNERKQMFDQNFPAVSEHAERWSIDLHLPGEIERKLEELVWLCALIYGVGGSTPGEFRADMALVHLVTSSLFLPSLRAGLSPRSRVLLLRGYLATVLTLWVRGPPAFDTKSFMATTPLEPSIPATPASNTPLTIGTTSISNSFCSQRSRNRTIT